jgi:hypothetical protein
MSVKMMLGGPLAGKAADFMEVHGRDGLLKAFKLSMNGLELQKQLAKKYLPHPDTQIRELGTPIPHLSLYRIVHDIACYGVHRHGILSNSRYYNI